MKKQKQEFIPLPGCLNATEQYKKAARSDICTCTGRITEAAALSVMQQPLTIRKL